MSDSCITGGIQNQFKNSVAIGQTARCCRRNAVRTCYPASPAPTEHAIYIPFERKLLNQTRAGQRLDLNGPSTMSYGRHCKPSFRNCAPESTSSHSSKNLHHSSHIQLATNTSSAKPVAHRRCLQRRVQALKMVRVGTAGAPQQLPTCVALTACVEFSQGSLVHVNCLAQPSLQR